MGRGCRKVGHGTEKNGATAWETGVGYSVGCDTCTVASL